MSNDSKDFMVVRQVFKNAEWVMGKTKPVFFATEVGAKNYAHGLKWLLTPIERYVVYDIKNDKELDIVEVMD